MLLINFSPCNIVILKFNTEPSENVSEAVQGTIFIQGLGEIPSGK